MKNDGSAEDVKVKVKVKGKQWLIVCPECFPVRLKLKEFSWSLCQVAHGSSIEPPVYIENLSANTPCQIR